MYEKLKLFASIEKALISSELELAFGIPPVEKRQPDLQYNTAVFVSSGFNLNSAYFMPTELLKARESVSHKPLDFEHRQTEIVGHIYSQVFAKKDRTIFDPVELYNSVGEDIENMHMDILVAMCLYKALFPELAEEVSTGKYCVSMECYFRDFDVIVDNLVIPRAEAQSLGLVDVVNNTILVTEGDKVKGNKRVGRVLRDMLFAGCGLVENPANLESIILETAGYNDKYILDLTKVGSYMKNKQEKEAIVVHSLEGAEKDLAYLSASYGGSHKHSLQIDKEETFLDGEHTHIVLPTPGTLPSGTSLYFSCDGSHRHSFNVKTGKIGVEDGHVHKVYLENVDTGSFNMLESGPAQPGHSHEFITVDLSSSTKNVTEKIDSVVPVVKKGSNMGETGYGGIHYHYLVLEDGTKLKTLIPTDVLKMGASVEKEEIKEEAGTGNVDGHPLSKPEICVSYQRYVYQKGGDDPGVPPNADKTPGLVPQVESLPAYSGGGGGDTVTQQDTIIHENWCTLFDTECPVAGGMAVHPDCLRLVLDSTTEEAISNYYEKLQVNRRASGINSALSSLKEVLDKTNIS